jgi:hypothetical protein
MSEISRAAAARFGLMLDARRKNDVPTVIEMLLSIPPGDIDAIKERLEMFGIHPQDLMNAIIPGVVI